MRGWVVCGSPDLFLYTTGGKSVRVSPLPGTQLLDHCRSPQMCSSAVLFGAVLVHAPLVVCPRLLLSYDTGRVIGHRVCCGSEQASMLREGPKAKCPTAQCRSQ